MNSLIQSNWKNQLLGFRNHSLICCHCTQTLFHVTTGQNLEYLIQLPAYGNFKYKSIFCYFWCSRTITSFSCEECRENHNVISIQTFFKIYILQEDEDNDWCGYLNYKEFHQNYIPKLSEEISTALLNGASDSNKPFILSVLNSCMSMAKRPEKVSFGGPTAYKHFSPLA